MSGALFAVGSLNPIKLQAVRTGVALLFADAVASAVAVASGVSAQPFGDEEMISGATQRAQAALQSMPEAAYGVGLEGGVLELQEGMFACAWCAVAGRTGAVGLASTGRFLLPQQVAALVRGGMELGAADDVVFGRSNSKQNEGAVGILTHRRLNRAEFYAPAVLLALVRFVNPEHFA
ncbi:MAG: inosine/xanthosine triphosphatase [Chloroflexi bacterium]|nr:inosine/xanthosine triphosphatase [Chloroflexota bacterium]MCL5275951.1 inosine/xanthosine triphosphatase [Chloroflexota bacterium]